MPILAGEILPPPVTPGPPISLPDIGRAVATYIDPTGGQWPLSNRALGWYTLAGGVSGLGAAPIDITADPYPRGGSRVRHIQPAARTITWSIRVEGDTHLEFVERWRALARAITCTTRLGPGVLEIARPDGSVRRIAVYYAAGFDGISQGTSSLFWDVAVVQWLCQDPYWYDAVPHIVHRQSDAAANYLNPYPSVSSSQVLGDTTVTNPGDVTAWPTWTITGPASLITMTRGDTGESFVLDPHAAAIGHGDLLAGQHVTVTTEPPTVRYQDGNNWIGALNWPGAVLWNLPPGDTPLTFELDGAAAGSAVDLSFNPRYETA